MNGTARQAGGATGRKPAWLRVKVPAAAPFRATAGLLAELALHTVCDSARCPNRGECFAAGTATFLSQGVRRPPKVGHENQIGRASCRERV